MQIRVMFFGATADAVGLREINVEIDGDETIGGLVEKMKVDHAHLAQMRLLSAINEEYADSERTLVAGDRVAIFTAVSGG